MFTPVAALVALLVSAGGDRAPVKPVKPPPAVVPAGAKPPLRLALTPGDLAGRYKGAITLPGAPLDIAVKLETTGGALRGFIDIPAQKVSGMALTEVALANDTLTFAMPGIPGNPRFEGKATKDGVEGTFTQGTGSFPFVLRRANPRDDMAPHLADWDAFVNGALKAWSVPGVAMAVVKDGEVVLAQGWGLRDVEKNLPVTPRTLFAIGSSSKAFTTAVMASLADEGRMDWDTPVQTYLPAFRLQDEYASTHITPRDLVTHLSGMPRHDNVWYNNLTLTRDEAVARLAYLPPNKSFRQQWQYNNLMFMAAGSVVEHISGKSWEANVRERLFSPLRMVRSNFSVKDSQKDPDHAEPYQEKKDVLLHRPFRDITTAGPAGSINSSAEEMARWVLLHLQGGTVDGTRILSAGALSELHTPRAVMPAPSDEPAVPLMTYAPGWMVDVYRGHRRIHHGGNIDGFSAQVQFFPDAGLGLVVLANKNAVNRFIGVLANTLSDRTLGLPTRDWNKEGLERRERGKALEKESDSNKAALRVTGTVPSHKVADYAGRYVHKGYGTLDVLHKDGQLTAVFNGIRMPLEHWNYDVFRSAEQKEEPDFEGLRFTFSTSSTGELDGVSVPLEPTLPDIRFERAADPRLEDPAFLKLLAGDYELAGKPVKVDVRGKTLTLAGPGSPPTDLVPSRGLAFTVKGFSILRVDFVLGADGRASELRISDPDGSVTARRK